MLSRVSSTNGLLTGNDIHEIVKFRRSALKSLTALEIVIIRYRSKFDSFLWLQHVVFSWFARIFGGKAREMKVPLSVFERL